MSTTHDPAAPTPSSWARRTWVEPQGWWLAAAAAGLAAVLSLLLRFLLG